MPIKNVNLNSSWNVLSITSKQAILNSCGALLTTAIKKKKSKYKINNSKLTFNLDTEKGKNKNLKKVAVQYSANEKAAHI